MLSMPCDNVKSLRKDLPFPAKSLKIILDWVYSDEAPPDLTKTEDVELVCQTMVVADHLMADRLIQMCELRASQLITMKNVTEIMQVGKKDVVFLKFFGRLAWFYWYLYVDPTRHGKKHFGNVLPITF